MCLDVSDLWRFQAGQPTTPRTHLGLHGTYVVLQGCIRRAAVGGVVRKRLHPFLDPFFRRPRRLRLCGGGSGGGGGEGQAFVHLSLLPLERFLSCVQLQQLVRHLAWAMAGGVGARVP